jgi:hypothetical protein
VSREGTFGSVIATEADEYFTLERLRVDEKENCISGFAILIALEGEANLICSHSRPVNVKESETVVVPYAAGQPILGGVGEVLIA